MEGSVSWKSSHLNEVWHGEVTRCVQSDHVINILFNCSGLGEGQLTLNNTELEQVTKGRFLYYDQRQATHVSVRGHLTAGDGFIAFEGVWTDPIDGLGAWKFSIEIEGDEFRAPADLQASTTGVVIGDPQSRTPIGTIDSAFLTVWYPINVTPSIPGMYQVRVAALGEGRAVDHLSANWDGRQWSTVTPVAMSQWETGWEREPFSHPDHDQILFWRGLTEKGYLSLALRKNSGPSTAD